MLDIFDIIEYLFKINFKKCELYIIFWLKEFLSYLFYRRLIIFIGFVRKGYKEEIY